MTFCWLAIDPGRNVREWAKVSERKQHALYLDAKRYGQEILPEEDAAKLGSPERKWRLDQRAEEVDDYWGPKIPGFRRPSSDAAGLLTFRGLYVGIFRPASRIAHAEPWSIDPRVRASPSQLVVTRENADPHVLALSIPLSVMCLLVYRHHFDWPEHEVAQAISDGLYYHWPRGRER